MSRNPPQRDFHQIMMKTMGIRASAYNLQNIGSPNAISPPIAIDKKLTKERNVLDPAYCSIHMETDYSAIQNTIRGLADEIMRFDDLEPSNEINNPKLEKSGQILEM